MFVFVKSVKGCFQRDSFNDKHVNLSFLKKLLHFLEFKKHLVVGPEKKRNTVCKNAPILHLMTFDPILKSTYEHLVIKNIFSMFISIQNLA